MERVDILAPCMLVQYGKKTGRINQCLEGTGFAMLEWWAIQNTPNSKETIVFERATGKIILVVSGNADFPDMQRYPEENIEDMCPGILSEINE